MRYRFGAYSLDTQCYELCKDGQRVPLRPKVLQVLTYLLEHRDAVVSKDALIAAVWPGQAISDETLSTCITAARRVVGDSGQAQRVIQTRHSYGYRFVAVVTVCDGPPADQRAQAALPTDASGEPGLARPHRVEGVTASAASMVALPLPPPSHPQGSLGGEQKPVTVLVCQLVPLAPLPSGTPRQVAEVQHQAMQTLCTLAVEAIQGYEGTLQSVQEDGCLILFGAPVAQEDHARRAVRAALGLRERCRSVPLDPAWPSGATYTVRLGVHTGPLLLGSLGAVQRLTYTAVGDTTQQAAWLAQQAAPGTILVSAGTARLVESEVRLEACVPRPCLGPSDPRAVYQVLGLGSSPTSLLSHGTRPRSRFVGRELELATLQALFARATEGQGQVVGIVGAPGIGKTRLLAELRQRLGETPVTVLEGQCLSYGQATPYGPIRDLLRCACGCTETDSAALVIANVRQYCQAMGLDPTETAPLLLHLLDVPGSAVALGGRTPEELRTATFATLHQLLWQTQQRQPLLVMVENLHWIDPTSHAFLTEVVERLGSMPLLLLVTFRPGYRPLWMEKSYATQLALPPLGPADSRRVVQAVLDSAPVPEPLMHGLLTKAAGNPLFLEELAWTVREQGSLQLPPEVPGTIQAVLAARIDRLPAEAKQVLQTAAVIGTEVPVSLLQAIATVPEAALHQSLAHLHATEFLTETRRVPTPTWTFKHALIQEVAYGSLLQAGRRTLHARIVEAMEALAGERVSKHLDRLAHHALQGEVWDKAVTYCRHAGTKAYTASAYREAVEYWEQALEALAHLPPDRAALAQAADVHGDLYHALHALRHLAPMLTHLRAAEALAEELADPHRLGSIYRSLANALRYLEDYDLALAYSQRAHALATACEDVGLQRESLLVMGWIAGDLGQYQQALEHFDQVLRSLQEAPDTQPVSLGHGLGLGLGHRTGNRTLMTRAQMVRCFIELGAFADAMTASNEARQLAEADAQPFEYVVLYRSVGLLHVRQGTLHQAITVLERAVALGRESDIGLNAVVNAVQLALAYALAGRTTDALPLLGQLEGFEVFRGEAYLYSGEVEEADRLAQRGLAHARACHRRGWEAWALWVLGEAAIHRDPLAPARAAAHYQQALGLAEALGMRPLQAHCHRGLGRLYSQTGRRVQACAALTTALAMYRAMEMMLWIPQTEATLVEVQAR